jgi:hypothetical protein|eukprot:COSAG01_NODE_4422_length_5037_cov_79.147226_4_plen_49_part_00
MRCSSLSAAHASHAGASQLDSGVGASFWLDEVAVCNVCTKNPENSGSG